MGRVGTQSMSSEPIVDGRDGRPMDPGARLAEVVRNIATDVSLLVRQQIELAKQEFGQAARARALGVGAFVAAGVLLLFVVGFLGITGAAALALVVPEWAANLIVAAAFAVLATVAVLVGRRALRTPTDPAGRTKETIREDVQWAKRQLRR
jgi:hypothetical protein